MRLPCVVATFAWSAARASAPVIDAIEMTALATGTAGVEIHGWSAKLGRWVEWARDSAANSAVVPIEAVVDAAGTPEQFVVGRSGDLHVRVRSIGHSGVRPDVQLAVDYLQLRVVYREQR